MQKFMGDSRGVSVVVGAIMLTLIVVTAATTYAIFLSDQQKKVQDAETVKLQRELENITILSLENPIYNSPTLDNVSFVIANMNAQQTIVTSLNINNNYIRHFNITRPDGVKEYYSMPFNGSGKRPIIYPREQIRLTINVSNGDVVIYKNITKNDAITLHIFTSLTNDFTKTFIPPTAIIKIDFESLPNIGQTYILDGSASDHPGDGYIVKWQWNVTNASTSTFIHPYGRKAQIDQKFLFGGTGFLYWVNLTVTDNFGMEGFCAFQYKP